MIRQHYQPRSKWASTPIINYVMNGECTREESIAFQAQLMAMHAAPRTVALNAYKREEWKGTVGFYKAVLGRQTYTWVGEYRCWVWETDDWRVYVGNIQGVSFEVREDLTKEQAMAAWDDFRARIGLHSPYAVGQRVLAYRGDEPGVFLGLDENYPGHGLVDLDSGEKTSAAFDNLRPA